MYADQFVSLEVREIISKFSNPKLFVSKKCFVMTLYIEPEEKNVTSSFFEIALPRVVLPLPEGPSIVIINLFIYVNFN